MGPVQVTVTTDVLPSKFKGKPPYVGLRIAGEDWSYSTENDECAAFFEGQKGRTFTIVAEGREQQAVLTYVGEAAPDPEPEREPAKPPAKAKSNRPPAGPPAGKKTSAPPPAASAPATGTHPPAQTAPPEPQRRTVPAETPEQAVLRVKRHANKVANTWVVSYAAALYAKQQVKEQLGIEVTQDQFQACVATICVQLERDGLHHAMPGGGVDAQGFYTWAPDVRPKGTAPASDNDGGGVNA